jgi:hypothetical protein
MATGEAISVGVLAVAVVLLPLPIGGPLLLFLIRRSSRATHRVKDSLKRVVCHYTVDLREVLLKEV